MKGPDSLWLALQDGLSMLHPAQDSTRWPLINHILDTSCTLRYPRMAHIGMDGQGQPQIAMEGTRQPFTAQDDSRSS